MDKYLPILIAFFIFCHCDIIAQKKLLLDKNTLNLYSNGFASTSTYSTASNQNNVRGEYEGFSFGFLSLALEKQIFDHFTREFEWLPIRCDYENTETIFTNSEDEERIINGFESFYFETAIRYQINYYPLVRKNKKLNPYIGLSNRVNFESIIREPKLSSIKTREQILGMTFQLSPGLEFKLHHSVKLVIDVPINLFNLDSRWQRVDNPAITREEQRNQFFEHQLLSGGVNFRVGLKIDLST